MEIVISHTHKMVYYSVVDTMYELPDPLVL